MDRIQKLAINARAASLAAHKAAIATAAARKAEADKAFSSALAELSSAFFAEASRFGSVIVEGVALDIVHLPTVDAAIAAAESAAKRGDFVAAWRAVREMRDEVRGLAALADDFFARVLAAFKAPISHRQRKLAKRTMATIARNERAITARPEVTLRKEGGRTVASATTSLRAALEAALTC